MTWRKDGALFRDDAFPFENFVTSRELGNMRDPAVREAFARSRGIDPGMLVTAEQVHGTVVAVVTSAGRVPGADGLLTRQQGLALAIFTADCVPIFFGAAEPCAAGLIHAGWRGLAHGIIPETVKQFKTDFGVDAADLVVSVGPHIQTCCYTVGKDLAEVFGLAEGETHLDLTAAAVRQLRQAGVARIESSPACTAHEAGKFFSYRRDKTADRIMSLVRLEPNNFGRQTGDKRGMHGA